VNYGYLPEISLQGITATRLAQSLVRFSETFLDIDHHHQCYAQALRHLMEANKKMGNHNNVTLTTGHYYGNQKSIKSKFVYFL